MNTLTVSDAIRQFATSVRLALDDLPAEEVEELTDGLEADLADRMNETDAAELGDPVAYADELRGAAGLPARSAPVRRPVREVMVAAVRQAVDTRPWFAAVLQFFVALRPLWWVYRGLAVAAIIAELPILVGRRTPVPFGVVLSVIVVVISVQLGRGRWLRSHATRVVLVVVSVASVLFGALALGVEVDIATHQSAPDDEPSYPSGLSLNGSQVTNVFAYDATGKPLTNVQLFDQDGNPLDLSGDPTAAFMDGYSESNADAYVVPNRDVPGRLAWNVYPLSIVRSDVADPATAPSTVPAPPNPSVSALVVEPTATPAPAP